MAQWLHYNRKEGCTKRAMATAIKKGHFEVVMFLHAHHRKGEMEIAVFTAAAGRHFALFQWLHERYPDQLAIDMYMTNHDASGLDMHALLYHVGI